MLSVGDALPNFALINQHGETISDKMLQGHPCVIYFYPKDMTPGCTMESCDFRDLKDVFAAQDVRILGVSKDSAASHLKFIEKYELNFDLLVDTEATFADACGFWVEKSMFGKKYMGMMRATLLVDAQGVVQKIWSKVKVKGHAQAVLTALNTIHA